MFQGIKYETRSIVLALNNGQYTGQGFFYIVTSKDTQLQFQTQYTAFQGVNGL